MAYYDFATNFFQLVDDVAIEHYVEYYQGKKQNRNPPSINSISGQYSDVVDPILIQLEEKINEESFQRNFLSDWRMKLQDEKDYQLKCFDSESAREKEIAKKEIEKSFSSRLNASFEQVINEIKNYPYPNYKIYILGELYNFYKKRKTRFPVLKGSRFECYYREKNNAILNKCKDNYGLVECNNAFEIKKSVRFKLHDKQNQSDLFISELIPDSFIGFLLNLRMNNQFDLAVRPNYDICGANLHISFRIDEAVIRGKFFEGKLETIPELTLLLDYDLQDRFIVRIEEGIVFEELLDEFIVDENSFIVTQGVHLQYEKNVITHLDHEFFFYSIDSYEGKIEDLKKHGSAKERYKTFKIDNARIPFDENISNNILYKTLHTFFKNHSLIDEYFEKILQENKPVDDESLND